MMAMVQPNNYPPLPPRSLPVSKSIPSGAAGPHDISSSEESSKSEYVASIYSHLEEVRPIDFPTLPISISNLACVVLQAKR